MTDNQEITNEEQLLDLLFELGEISSAIAVMYFKADNIPIDEILLLSDIKLKFDSSSEMINQIITPIARKNQK